jgi:hypothetical protein
MPPDSGTSGMIRLSESFGFEEYEEDNCINVKSKKGKYIFLVLYVDDILLASSDKDLLAETESFFLELRYETHRRSLLCSRIEFHRDRHNGVLELSQKSYIEKY